MLRIAVAGTVLVDHINGIAKYPSPGELVNIESRMDAPGGCVPNVAIDLALLMPGAEVFAFGRVGRDGDARLAADKLRLAGVNADGLTESDKCTGFTEVMSVAGGERTFFTCPGANADFGAGDVDFDRYAFDRLHLGYFFLLDKVDRGDGQKLLCEARRRGIKTSIDLVSDSSADPEEVRRCLGLVDDLIINEREAAAITGMAADEDPRVMAEKLRGMGAAGRVIIHRPDLSLCLSERGLTAVPSLVLPEGYIKGATGAGDAFTAGALIGISLGLTDSETLELASCAAAAALGAEDATGGMMSIDKLKTKFAKTGRQKICWQI